MEEAAAVMKGVDWEVLFFLRSFFLGFCLRMGYDVFLILRRILRHRRFLITMEDFIFWMTGSVFMFGLLFRENNGTPRLFALLGVLAGMILYHFGPSPLILGLFDRIRDVLKKMHKIIRKKVEGLLQKLAKQSRMNSKESFKE